MYDTNKLKLCIALYLFVLSLAALVANGAVLTGSCDNIGQQYYKTLPNVCLHVQCINGQEVLQQNHMCRDETGQCHKQGQEVRVSKCMTKTCVFKGNRLFYEISTQACNIGGKCVNVNSSLRIGCTTHRCKAVQHGQSLLMKAEVVDMGCQDDMGVCHKVGDKIKQGHCVEKRCKLTEKGIGFELTKTDCYDSEQNVCRGAGVEWTNSDCQRLVCEKTIADSGTVNLKIKMTSAGCPGDNFNECHSPNDGTMFSKRINNSLQYCECISGGDNPSMLQYRCTSI